MKNIIRIFTIIFIISLLVSTVSGASDKTIDKSKEKKVVVENVPSDLKGKISITGADSSYNVKKDKQSIIISKAESKGEHTKTKCSMDVSAIQSLQGYSGKEFSVLHVVDGKVVGFQVLKTKDVLSGKTITFDATFSEVIVSGMTGSYTKTVSIDTLNTTIPFAVSGATGLNVQIDNPDTYIAFNESNISTYPDSSKWLFAWPLNGNANDITGNARHGTITAAASTAGRSGASNTGYYLDGDNDYVSLDYADTLYSSNTLFLGYKLNHTLTDSNHVVADFRNPSGVGRTGIYEYENSFYVNNATSVSTLNSTTNTGWKYGFYPFSSGQINYIWLGVRYNLLYDFKGWLDCAGLYNGTLTADQRRVFGYGYQGITAAPYPTATRTPIMSSNQSVTPPSTMTGVNIQSPTSETKTVTLTAYLQQNATLVNEYNNATHHRVDILFTAGSNITSGSIEYQMLNATSMGAPSLTTNESGASVSIDGSALTIDFDGLLSGETRYFNISLPMGTYGITGYSPIDVTPEIYVGGSQTFTATINATTNVEWLVNGSNVETDLSTTSPSYDFVGTTTGSYNVTAKVYGDQQTWILTVRESGLESHYPSSSNVIMKNDSIQQFKVQYAEPLDVVWKVNNTSEFVTLDLTPSELPYMNFYNHLALEHGTSEYPPMPNILITEFNSSNQVVANITITNCTPAAWLNFTLSNLTTGTEYYFVNSSGYVDSSVAGDETYLNITGISDGVYYIASKPDYEPSLLISEFNSSAQTVANITITNTSVDTHWNITIHDLVEDTRYYFMNDTGVVMSSIAGSENTYFNFSGISDGVYYIKTSPVDGVVRRDYDTHLSAYWFNASDIGYYNITAMTDSGQVTWFVNVTSNTRPGSGVNVVDAIAVTTFLIAAGSFVGKFGKRSR